MHVDSYDPESGKYQLTLRNDSLRSAIFLHYLVTYSTNPTNGPVGRPTFPPDEPVMLHDRRLEPKSTFQIAGTCSSSEACRQPGTYAGVYACWFTARWECDQYLFAWSDRALNGP
ncbi:hypothetical protein GCM10027430_35280 [Lysobacter tyrosinilyticus]